MALNEVKELNGNAEPLRGYRNDIGLDGLPTDPDHPFNRAR